jgi:hypothetical protein
MRDQGWATYILTLGNILHPAKFLHMAEVAVNIATVAIELFAAFIFVSISFGGRPLGAFVLWVIGWKEGRIHDFVWKDWTFSTVGHIGNAIAYLLAAIVDIASVLSTPMILASDYNNRVKKRLGIIPKR